MTTLTPFGKIRTTKEVRMSDEKLICVKKGGKVKRVPVSEAEGLVAKGWGYTSKKEWRKFRAKEGKSE